MPAAAWAARSGDPVLYSERRIAAGGDGRGPQAPSRRPGLRPRALLGDLLEGRPPDRHDRQPGAAGLGRGPGHQRDRPRPLLRRRLRLERQRPGPRLRRRPLGLAARRGRRGAALGLGHLGAAAAHRQRRYASGGAAGIPARRQAGLHDRPDPRLLQPRVGDRRPGRDRRDTTGGNRRAGRIGEDRRRNSERGREPQPAGDRPRGQRRGHPRPGRRLHPPLRPPGPQPHPAPDRAAARPATPRGSKARRRSPRSRTSPSTAATRAAPSASATDEERRPPTSGGSTSRRGR